MAYTPLKNYFGIELLNDLSYKILRIQKNFDSNSFIEETSPLLEHLELKDRTYTIADGIEKYLPGGYEKQIAVLVKILGPENPDSYGTFMKFFWTWVIGAFIERHGLAHGELSIRAIKELTKRGTGEFAIRPLIRNNPQALLKVMHLWSLDENFHVRRLSSEGLRPNLPWAKKMTLFIDNPDPVFSIINNLKNDSQKYVQTSVANLVNDYLKVNNSYAMHIIRSWSKSPQIHTKWIIKHAIRNYRKKKEPWALKMTEKMNEK